MSQKYWLAENGMVRCLDEACPQECDMGCPIYLQTIALEFFQTNQFDKAAAYLEKAVAIEPTFADAWNNLAACSGQMGNHRRAYECYLKSYELLAKPNPLFGMAVAMKNLGNYSQAIQYAKLYEKRFGADDRINRVLSDVTKLQDNKDKAKFVKKSRNGKYGLWESGDRFLFCSSDKHKPEVFVAADNRPVTTSYRSLADAMLEDLDTYGSESEDYESIAKWQYDLVNDYVRMEAPEFADIVKKECFSEPDWTESIDQQDPWTLFFRHGLLDEEGIKKWIDKCTHMQLNAILHLYWAFKSIRIAQCVARVMEEFLNEDVEGKLGIVIKWIVDHSEYSYLYTLKIINVFKLYYGIHLDEHGDLFDDTVDYEEDQFFVGQKVSEEILVGRNYYLYEEGLRAKNQPKHYEPVDIALDCSSDDEDDEDDEEETDEPEYDELEAYVPERCWIKRISALEDGQEAYFLIAVTVDDDYMITGVTYIYETVVQRGGGMFFFTPGLFDGASESEYEEMYSYPSRVFDELSYLVTGRALKHGFSIIGKPIPQWMRDNDEYNTFAMQSGYRSAYMHISIDSDEDGCFTDLDYSTYQSSNSAYGDMFSRPQSLSDREDEAVDMLLYIIDHYTDDEWKKVSEE